MVIRSDNFNRFPVSEEALFMISRPEFSIRPMHDEEEDVVIHLWQKAGLTRAHNNPEHDIKFARQSPASDVLVATDGSTVIASVMVGHDGHRGSVYYVAADPDAAGTGLGRAMMDAAEVWLKERGVWKLNLMVRASNAKVHGFYEALGYQTQPRTVFTKWLEEPDALPDD